jgi:hypothetical protein
LKLIKPQPLNGRFVKRVQPFIPEGLKGLTVSFDGKTVCSTGKMGKYGEALNTVSAQIAELGVTFARRGVFAKSNEIPGCAVAADAPRCQKETAEAVIEGKVGCLLSVKGNQKALKADIEGYVRDSVLRKGMDTFETAEKNRGRLEKNRLKPYPPGNFGEV